jgi:hypothetical protein
MPFAFRFVLCAALFSTALRAEEGCTKDTDCKGDRICVQRMCVAPQQPDAPVSRDVPARDQPPNVPPPPPPPPDGARPAPIARQGGRFGQPERHRGFYLRLDLGAGYLSTSASERGADFSIYGGAGQFGVAIGAALRPNHILALHLWDVADASPTVSLNGTSQSVNNAKVDLFCIGPQYNYYTPDNFYISITPGLSRLHSESTGTSGDSNWGFGLRAALGKEWWVSDFWGLGVVGQFSFSTNQDQGSNAGTLTTWGATVAFSATYN